MSGRLGRAWEAMRDSLWFIPGLLALAAALLATGLVEVDSRISRSPSLGAVYIAFSGGVEGARGVLTAIASTTVTVTGVVFSLTIVTLQLAASQFSPRVLRSFSRDRVSHVTMGAFIGTFAYALLVLRTVRSGADDGETFVPAIATGVAILLVLASTGLLIFYIHHVARSIQASPLIDRIAGDANAAVERLFPEPVGEAAPEPPDEAVPDGQPGAVAADRAGYLQAVDEAELFSLAAPKHGEPLPARPARPARLTLRMERLVGEFVVPGVPLVSVWPAEAAGRDDVLRAVRRAFALGPERTLQHDAGLGIRQLADIAIKALSPGINDPTTAVTCIDRLSEVLINLGRRRPPSPVRRDERDGLRFIARELTFAAAVDLAFAQVRHYARADASVLAHLLVALGRIGAAVPPHLRPVLETQVWATLEAARLEERPRSEATAIEHAAEAARAALALPQTGSNPPAPPVPPAPVAPASSGRPASVPRAAA
jgi:uncharacterized membrane protein